MIHRKTGLTMNTANLMHKSLRQALLAIAITIICSTANSRENSLSNFKCNNQFVTLGDSKALVFLKCGEPLFREQVSGDNEVKIEEWTYRPRGNRTFLRILTFRRGKLTEIERGDATRLPPSRKR